MSSSEALLAFETCVKCGLERGEVRAARCDVAQDRLHFTLDLDCSLEATRAETLARTVAAARLPVASLEVSTEHGTWRVDGGLRALSRRPTAGIQFTVTLLEVVDDESLTGFYEVCLRALRVRLMLQAGNIIALSSQQAVRRRPAMYIDPVDPHVIAEATLCDAARGWLANSTWNVDVRLRGASVTVTDDGVPLSFERRDDGRTQVEHTFGQHSTSRRGSSLMNRFDLIGVSPLVVAALSSELMVESSDGAQATRQVFERGQATPTMHVAAWQPAGTRVTVTPDADLFDTVLESLRLLGVVRRVAALCPGLALRFNDELVRATQFAQGLVTNAWNGETFVHTVRHEGVVCRCALGLSERGDGGVECLWNLGPLRLPEAVREALVDGVGFPTERKLARGGDLVGVVSFESVTAAGLEPAHLDTLRKSLGIAFAVFLDSIPGSREVLVKRWR